MYKLLVKIKDIVLDKNTTTQWRYKDGDFFLHLNPKKIKGRKRKKNPKIYATIH